jgi:hypothetical protein
VSSLRFLKNPEYTNPSSQGLRKRGARTASKRGIAVGAGIGVKYATNTLTTVIAQPAQYAMKCIQETDHAAAV